WLLAGGGMSLSILLAFLAFHLFLYGGATAFNSYYDRDEGPVGGLERPPPVVPQLLPFSLAMKTVGWLLAAAINWPFFWTYGSFACALLCQAIGGAMMVAVLFQRYGLGDALLAGAALAVQLLAVARWATRFDQRQVIANYRYVMRLNRLSAVGLALYLGYHLL